VAKKHKGGHKKGWTDHLKKGVRGISYVVLGVGLGGPAIVGTKRALDAGNPAGAPAEILYEYTGLQSDGNMNWAKTQQSILQIVLTVAVAKGLRWAAR
jgi:hypothetical protein